MRASLNLFVAVLMFTLTSATAAVDPTQWPSSPSRLTLDTPYGDLHVSPSDYVYESRLMLDDHEIQPLIKGLLNIPYAFSSTDFHVVLVSIDSGEQICPVTYKWITLNTEGYSATPRFGSCSEFIKVSAKGTTFTVVTPSEANPDELDSYVYDGKTVKKKSLSKTSG